MSQKTRASSGSTFYYKIYDGQLRRKALPTDEQSFVVTRTNEAGRTFDEFVPDSLSGRIKSMELFTNEFEGKKITEVRLLIDDIGELYNVSVPQNSRFFSGLVSKLPNVDFNKDVEFSTYKFKPKDGNKELSGVTIKQGGVKVANFYSKDNNLPGSPDFPAGGDDNDVKLWGLQHTIALTKSFKEQRERLINSLGNTVANEVAASAISNEETDEATDLPF